MDTIQTNHRNFIQTITATVQLIFLVVDVQSYSHFIPMPTYSLVSISVLNVLIDGNRLRRGVVRVGADQSVHVTELQASQAL